VRTTLIAAILIAAATLAGAGELRLAWDAPTHNTDGSVYDNPAGYILAWGYGVDAMTNLVETETTELILTVENNRLVFAKVKAVSDTGNESEYMLHKEGIYETTPKAPSNLLIGMISPSGTNTMMYWGTFKGLAVLDKEKLKDAILGVE